VTNLSSSSVEAKPSASNAELARRALEDVCARGDLEAAKGAIAADFVDT
jgi:hypothetical protein